MKPSPPGPNGPGGVSHNVRRLHPKQMTLARRNNTVDFD